MSNSLIDGLNRPDQLADESVDASEQKIIGTGSPSGFGLVNQTGTVNASDVVVWTSFGTAFLAAPSISYGIAESGAAASHPGCTVTSAVGSFSFLGTSGLDYYWSATGSGTF